MLSLEQHVLVLDIETVPADNHEDYYKGKKYKAPSNYKDPAKIEDYINSARLSDMEGAGLHWWTGKIICICGTDAVTGESYNFYGENEKEILTKFFDVVLKNNYTTFIGKNSSTFDMPFIVGRALHHDTGLPPALFNRSIRDIDHVFSYSSQCAQRSSLADYAWGLGIQGKSGHGSEVHGMYLMSKLNEGEWDNIVSYCKNDVAIVVEMFRRYCKQYVTLLGGTND